MGITGSNKHISPPPLPANGRSSHRVSVQRRGTLVTVALESSDEYAAIELYEQLILAAKNGHLRLEIATGETD